MASNILVFIFVLLIQKSARSLKEDTLNACEVGQKREYKCCADYEERNDACFAGIETYFNTIKQRRQMEEDGKKASHNRKMVLYGRKNRKLQNRVKTLQAKKLPVSEEDKLMKVMKIDFMSSEDSDSEDESRLITRPLTWLSKDFKSYMDKLDSKYQRQLNAQGKKLRSKRVVSRPSERPCAKKSPDLAWVFA